MYEMICYFIKSEISFLIKFCLVIIICLIAVVVLIKCLLVFFRLLLVKRIYLYILCIVSLLLIIKLKIIFPFLLCFLLSIFCYNYIKLCKYFLSKHEYKKVYFLYRCLVSIISILINIFFNYTIGFAESTIILDLQMQMQVLSQELLANQDILNEIQNSLTTGWLD
jgi:hypothetical protein